MSDEKKSRIDGQGRGVIGGFSLQEQAAIEVLA